MKNQSSQLFKEVVTKVPQWENVPVGTKFKAKIEGIWCEGRIQKEGSDIYLCQNEKNGSDADNKLGYHHSWTINDGSIDKLKSNSVEIFDLELDPTFKPLPEWDGNYIADYKPVIGRGHVKFGCKIVSNEDIRKLVSMLVD
jgi:hypothetical protein